MVSPFFLPESGAPSVCLQLAYLFYVVLHLLFESAVLERPFKRNVWTVPYLVQELEKDPTHHIKKYRAVFAQGRGVAWPKAGTFNDQQSIQVTTAEQWARKNLAG
jgi:hypothetical protein